MTEKRPLNLCFPWPSFSLSFSLISFILYFFYRFVYALPRSPFVGDNNIQELKLSFSLSRHTQNEWKQQHNFEVVCTYVRTLSNAHFFSPLKKN
ncbi:Uncharacterized protein APZ42_031788 [Daphnia magna]|uniref:Uncharacterized protein n=1 Tax=Daphnia magna TaxID=35525 RepID=A0A162DAY4_9CRUS|nr:Uncharacterized protein APZ42_031788 [Daphnia magna]